MQALQRQWKNPELLKEIGEALVAAGVFRVETQGVPDGLARLFNIPLVFVALAQDYKPRGVVGKVRTALFAQFQRVLDIAFFQVEIGEAGEER